jgi:short-subunit dehydrogenase
LDVGSDLPLVEKAFAKLVADTSMPIDVLINCAGKRLRKRKEKSVPDYL